MSTQTVQDQGMTFVGFKVDAEKRMVYGVLTSEAPDSQGECFDYESSLPHYKEWSSKVQEVSGGKSLGNVREQHARDRVVGKIIEMNFDDATKSITVGAKIVDDNAWKKCQEGVLNGFSHGFKYLRRWAQDGVKRYTAAPYEASIVDVPANPESCFLAVKCDGSVEEVEAVAPAAVEGEKRSFTEDERKKLADEGKALPDGSFPIENEEDLKNAIHAYGRAKDKEAAKKHIEKRAKELGKEDLLPEKWEEGAKAAEAEGIKHALANISWLASSLADMKCLCKQMVEEAEWRNDNSPIPKKFKDWVEQGIGLLTELMEEEHEQAGAKGATRHSIADRALLVAVKKDVEAHVATITAHLDKLLGGEEGAKAAQAEVDDLVAARDTALAQLATLTAERDAAIGEKSAALSEKQELEETLTKVNTQLKAMLNEPNGAKAAKNATTAISKDDDAVGTKSEEPPKGRAMLKAIYRGQA